MLRDCSPDAVRRLANAKDSDLWRSFAQLILAKGARAIRLTKVRAHCTLAQVGLIVSPTCRAGNA
eukprot:305424-Alexandrium_andersonii.AAC.1